MSNVLRLFSICAMLLATQATISTSISPAEEMLTVQGPIDCLTAAFNVLRDLYRIFDDIMANGPWFNKEEIMIVFLSAKRVFESCGLTPPKYFRYEKCLGLVKQQLDKIDRLAYLVDIEDYDQVWIEYLSLSPLEIETVNVCLNTNLNAENNTEMEVRRV